MTVQNCKVANYTTAGITNNSAYSNIVQNEVTAGSGTPTGGIYDTGGALLNNNYVHDGAGPGITFSGNSVILANIISNMSGATADGIFGTGQAKILYNSVYNSGRDGINVSNTSVWYSMQITGNILVSNAAYGIVGPTAHTPAGPLWDGNAFYNNTSGTTNQLSDTTTDAQNGVAPYTNVYNVTLTGVPFNNTGTGDFSLNGTSGAGAACKNSAPLRSFGGLSVTQYRDMGAVQHNDPGTVTITPNFAY